MSAATLTLTARLGGDPEKRKTRTGSDWATARAAASLSRNEDDPATWFSITAFGDELVNALCQSARGEKITVTGKLQTSVYQGKTQFSVIADEINGVQRAPSDGVSKPKTPAKTKARSEPKVPWDGDPLDDLIPF